MRVLLTLFVVAAVAVAGVYLIAGRASGPLIEIRQPSKWIGQAGALDVAITAPEGRFTFVRADIEQDGRRTELFSWRELSQPGGAVSPASEFRQETPERIRITRPLGRQSVPGLRPGPARVIVAAGRPVLYGFREASAEGARHVEVRFDPPRISVVSTHHFINHGGSEMVVYRVSPPEAESGVSVGDLPYPGFAASGAAPAAEPGLNVAFFALLHDQDLVTPIALFAKDAAGNQAVAQFEHRVFPKPFRRSRIEIDEALLKRVVPAILDRSPELKASAMPGDLLQTFLTINGDLRRMNAEKIAALAARTSPQMLWKGAFQQLGGSQVESSFADHRTYLYQRREIDQQVHLGFDLAVTANVPIQAANDGAVLYAADLGIYGNCVILDHGMGVHSLYAHLSSFEVGEGGQVRKGQVIGRSGMTGLAGGDHLHFTMLINGHPVNAVDWWDPHWIEDRIMRKLRALGTGSR